MTFPGAPVVVIAPAATVHVRLYDSRYYGDGSGFRYYGPHPRGRFDHHPAGPPVRHLHHGVLYLTTTLACAVAETFGDAALVSPGPDQRLSVVALTRDVVLADTRGRAAVELGVPAGALRARDRALTQRVARELYAQTDAEGVLYEGWFTGETCVALWERARDAVELVDDRSLADPAVAADLLVIADELHYAAGDLGPF
ncbi:MAG: RES domain-containing protein [Frankiaceae bacterium]